MTNIKARETMSEQELQERKHQLLAQSAAAMVAQSATNAISIKDMNLFFLCKGDGDVPLSKGHGLGLYYNDCRYLSGYELGIGGAKANVLTANWARGYKMIFELTNPPLKDEGQQAEINQVAIRWERQLDGEARLFEESFDLHNYGQSRARFTLGLTFQFDFRDSLAVRNLLPNLPGELVPPHWSDTEQEGSQTLTCLYHGADGLERQLAIRLQPPPDRSDGTTAQFDIDLDPEEERQIQLQMALTESPSDESKSKSQSPQRDQSSSKPSEPIRQGSREPLESQIQVETDSMLFNSILKRSLIDLHMLRSQLGPWHYYAAGIPWFVAPFGRDSLMVALQMLAFNPDMATQTLHLLAGRQADTTDSWTEAEPGKIFHELRCGELSNIHAAPFTPYYRTVDANPLFLMLLGRYTSWAGSLDLFEELRDTADRALIWIDEYGDSDGDGYVEYDSPVTHGRLINKGWKDSGNGILYPDGHLPKPPIALVEVQGYVYRAKLEMATLYARAGEQGRAERLRQEASDLRARFNRDFWSDELGCYVLALDGDKHPIPAVTSNPGHALWSGIADDDKARRTSDRLMTDDMFSGWGIRTLSSAHTTFNPIGYHLGTVWPHDNAIAAEGFRRYELDTPARRIADGIISAASDFAGYRLPECFSGYSRSQYEVPVHYPMAAHPQAWSSGSILYLLTIMLGLQPEGHRSQLRLARPMLPNGVDWVKIRELRVGQGQVDLQFRREEDGGCAVSVDRVQGDLDVVVELAT